jgi:eukaryotic-like serine/threonine-protein kinase
VTRSGLILDDRYRLDERIAAGGVGQVWRATDLLLERPVAVKLLRPEYSDHPETLERFRKEAKNAGALNNPHVAQVYDYGPSGPGGSPYLVMEFVDGPSLADLLAVDPIDPALALDVIAQAADGLAAAHKAGVIHRDIKPGNILISSEGKVKVTDFGIAHAAGQVPVTQPGLVMGTTQYMAPERIAGNQGTAASDLYALGIVLHECLTGVPPHDGTAAEVMAAHLYMPLPPLPADVPAELDVLVDRLTAKDPARRISGARELAGLAARLRDAIGAYAPAPPAHGGAARSGAQSGPAAASSSPVPQGHGPGYDPTAYWPGDDRPAGSGQADGGGGDISGSTMLLAPPDGRGGPAYGSGDWNVPPRMSLPTAGPGPGAANPPGRGRPGGNRRRRAAIIGIGVALVASGGLIALLLSGVFSSTPAANQSPAGSPATGSPAVSRVPSHGTSGVSRTSGPAGGTAGPSAAATPAATSPLATPRDTQPSRQPTARPSSSSPAGPTSGEGTPTAGASTGPASPSATASSGTPSTRPSESPSPSPSCFLIFC